MALYYVGIDHTNSSDDEEEVIRITATEKEPRRIISVLINSETNSGKLRMYIDRENLFSGESYWKTGVTTIRNYYEIEVNRTLSPGETFKLTLQNITAGTNASISGAVKVDVPAE